MPRYVIERDIPMVGNLSATELREIAATSCAALKQLSPTISWVRGYVTGDRVYCVYSAPNEGTVREDARPGGFLASRIAQQHPIINSTAAE